MNDHIKAFDDKLAVVPKGAKPVVPAPRVYDFEQLGGHLADTMMQAAEDMLREAQKLADHTQLLAADVRVQVNEQSKLLADINTRLKATGEQMLEAHRRFNGSP
jgi:hypothetical protein